MSRPTEPAPARPFASILFVDGDKLGNALDALDELLGLRCFTSEARPFDRTNYYKREMGEGIQRIFTAWEGLVDPSELVRIKHDTWEIEERLMGSPGRAVNIDPGLIEEGRFVLATGKPVAHRPYLGDGVYIDLTLIYEHKSYRPLPWTYPDYKEAEIIELLNTLRAQYLKDLKAVGGRPQAVGQ